MQCKRVIPVSHKTAVFKTALQKSVCLVSPLMPLEITCCCEQFLASWTWVVLSLPVIQQVLSQVIAVWCGVGTLLAQVGSRHVIVI